jgi:hypothetical protein
MLCFNNAALFAALKKPTLLRRHGRVNEARTASSGTRRRYGACSRARLDPPRRASTSTVLAHMPGRPSPRRRGSAWHPLPGLPNEQVSRAHARTRTRGPLALIALVSTIQVVSEHPSCAALLHGGKRCRSVAVVGSEFCPHHDRLVPEQGADALKQGTHLPAGRKRVVQAAVVAGSAASAPSSFARTRARAR